MKGGTLVVVLCGWLMAGAARAEPVGFSPATRAMDGPKGCPSGSFLDARLDDWSVGPQCWSCPSGYARTLDAVTAPTACMKDGGTQYKDADFEHKWLCDGDKREFLDPRKGGECWKCPKDLPRRTAYAVTSKKACATEAIIGERLGKASYVRKAKSCEGRAFFDPRKGGECWKCPSGYGRTTEAVTGKKACVKESADSWSAARLENQLGCAKGSFVDPRNGGECWSCPGSHPIRTMETVDGPKACTNSLVGLVPTEGNAVCKSVIRALRRGLDEGTKAKAMLEQAVEPFVAPVKAVLQDKLAEMTALAGDFEALDPYVAKLQEGPGKVLAEFGTQVAESADRLRATLLDEAMCDANPKEIEKRLAPLLKVPKALGSTFVSVSLGAAFTHSVYKATAQVGITWVTNLDGKGGLFVSGRVGATTSEEPFQVGLSAMLFPGATLEDFALTGVPAINVGVAKGKGFDELFEKHPMLLTATRIIDGIDVSWSPATPTKIPTFGVSKGVFSVGGNIKSLFDFTATVGWDFPIFTYVDWTIRPL